ncbi:MAG TPA: DUF5777 family beta-barrel protein [Holophagaceae bacterium]|nr:DUF5777 family beta-barrel protein [Holophagaceae bacterium]
MRALPLGAQDASEFPHAINLPTADHLEGWDIGFLLTHRFVLPAKGHSKDLYGLDEHANAGFGLDFGIQAIPGLDAQIYRTADMKTLSLALQERVVATDHWRVAVRVARYDETVEGGRQGGLLQVPVDWQVNADWTFSVVPTYLTRTATAEKVATAGFGVRWMPGARHGVLAEYYPRPSQVSEAFEQGWSLGYQYRTRGHRFTLVATNIPAAADHQVLGGDYSGLGPRPSQYWSLAFNIVRIF